MKNFIVILIGFLIVGCGGSDRPDKPDNLIPEDKMSEIIYDVFLMNAAKGINKRLLEQNGVFPQEYVFEKHKIDSLQFALSNDYYSYDAKTYEDIILKVKSKIELEKSINDSINLKEEKIKDSLTIVKNKTRDSLNQFKIEAIVVDTISPPKKPKVKPKVFGESDE